MTIKLSLSEWACYDTRLKYKSLPNDLVSLNDVEYKFWKSNKGNNNGKTLSKGIYPFELVDYIEPEKNQEQINSISRRYLSQTDWYIIRSIERGIAVPNEITKKRQEAIESIVD